MLLVGGPVTYDFTLHLRVHDHTIYLTYFVLNKRKLDNNQAPETVPDSP